MAGFKQFAAAHPGSLAMDMNVLVLTSGFWPTYRSFDCLLPTEVLKAQQVRDWKRNCSGERIVLVCPSTFLLSPFIRSTCAAPHATSACAWMYNGHVVVAKLHI